MSLPKLFPEKREIYTVKKKDAGSLPIPSGMDLSSEYTIHSSLLPIFIPFYQSDTAFEAPLEIKDANHRGLNFNEDFKKYFTSYFNSNELTGLSTPFYVFPYVMIHQKIRATFDDTELGPMLGCEYEASEDDKAYAIKSMSIDDSSKILDESIDEKVCKCDISIFYL